MTWIEFHRRSETYASEAQIATREGKYADALLLYAEAAEFEQRALKSIEEGKPRTFGITAVSAIALLLKARNFDHAERIAYNVLNDHRLPSFAKSEIKLLVQTIWTEASKAEATVRFFPSQVTVSIKGGTIVTGGAPLDLIVNKVQSIQAIFYRVIEHERNMPHRVRGPVPKDVQEACKPWLFQAPPGSYQFSVAVEEPKQGDFFKTAMKPDQIAEKFLQIVGSAGNDDLLTSIVPESDYKRTFLKLTRNLAPTGVAFATMELRKDGAVSPTVTITSEARTSINRALNNLRIAPDQHTEIKLFGTLRALDLDRDWMMLSDGDDSHRIFEVSEVVDDVIGPMVNQRVSVLAYQSGSKLKFLDIQLEE